MMPLTQCGALDLALKLVCCITATVKRKSDWTLDYGCDWDYSNIGSWILRSWYLFVVKKAQNDGDKTCGQIKWENESQWLPWTYTSWVVVLKFSFPSACLGHICQHALGKIWASSLIIDHRTQFVMQQCHDRNYSNYCFLTSVASWVGFVFLRFLSLGWWVISMVCQIISFYFQQSTVSTLFHTWSHFITSQIQFCVTKNT